MALITILGLGGLLSVRAALAITAISRVSGGWLTDHISVYISTHVFPSECDQMVLYGKVMGLSLG